VEERERGDLNPRDDNSHPRGRSMPDGKQDHGEQARGDAREVLRLGERFEHAGRRVGAQIVEDGEVEEQERQQGAGQAEQEPGGTPKGRVEWS
jgi:hypothetical protein